MKCRQWEKCQNSQCLDVHPMCTADASCRNTQCGFTHSDGRRYTGGPKLCKFASNCTNKSCTFSHPPGERARGGEPSVTISPDAGKCRFGSQCTNNKCTFSHPTTDGEEETKTELRPCKYGLKCTNKQCTSSHVLLPTPLHPQAGQKPCQFGAKCTSKLCTYSHPSPSEPKQDPKPCMFGSNCTNKQCTYSHALAGDPVRLHVAEESRPCKFGSKCRLDSCSLTHSAPLSEARASVINTALCFEKYQLEAALKSMSSSSKAIDRNVCNNRLHSVPIDAPSAMLTRILSSKWPSGEQAQLVALIVQSLLGTSESYMVLESLNRHLDLIRKQQLKIDGCVNKLWATSSTDSAFARLQAECAAHERGMDELNNQKQQFEEQLCQLIKPDVVNVVLLQQAVRREAFRLAPFQVKGREKSATNPLPALAKRPELLTLLRTRQLVIVRGETGSGKSTQLPQYLADYLGPGKKVVCTQPRKIAAITLSQRVAYEYAGGSAKASREVGCKVGSKKAQNKQQAGSVITFMTEALLLKSLLKTRKDLRQPCGWHAIILDEAHERSVNTDLLLGLVKERLEVDKELIVVVTSATLDAKKFIDYFSSQLIGPPPLLQIPGRMFPVEENYVPVRDEQNLVTAAVRLAFELHNQTSLNGGDILVFLAAQEDTEVAKSQLKGLLAAKPGSKNAIVLCLYGKQLPEEHEKVFAQTPPQSRKIVFSTNVAETSVTIDGVRLVIDSGVCKENRFDAKRNMFLLEETSISQSSATQRKGRAGRTSPGSVYRLFSREDYDKMRTGQVPELLRAPLGLTILRLLERNILINQFKFIDPPSTEDISVAVEELFFLGALENPSQPWSCLSCTFTNCASCIACNHSVCELCDAKRVVKHPGGFALTPDTILTEFGKFAARADIDPRVARILFVGAQNGLSSTALTLASLLSVEGNVKFRGGDSKAQNKADLLHVSLSRQLDCESQTDVLFMFRAYERWDSLAQWWVDEIHGKPEHYAVDGECEQVKEEDQVTLLTESLLQKHNAEHEQDEDRDTPRFLEASQGPDDTASVASESKSVAAENMGFRRTQMLQKQWCRGWSLNSKSLGIAQSTRRELELVMRTANLNLQQKLGKVEDDEILNLFFAGFFLNVASKCGRQYKSLGSHLLNFIHPSSPLLRREDNLPQHLSFFKVFSTSKNFLLLAVPISTDDNILEKIVPVGMLSAFKAKLAPIQVVSKRLPSATTCYSTSLVRAVLGIKSKDKASFEEQFAVTLEVEFNHPAHVIVWGVDKQVNEASVAIAQRIKAQEAELLQETHEETMIGSTRASFGSGCSVQRLLVGGSFLRIFISNLPSSGFSLADLREIAGLFGKVRACGLELLKSGKFQWGYVTYLEPEAAEKALIGLDQQPCKNGQPMNVRKGSEVSESQCRVSDSTIAVSWSTEASSGNAVIKYPTAKDANNCLRQAPLLGYTVAAKFNLTNDEPKKFELLQRIKGLSEESTQAGNKAEAATLKAQKQLLQAQLSALSGGEFFSEETKTAGTGFTVKVSKLKPDVDEVELMRGFRAFGNVVYANVHRGSFPCPKFQSGQCNAVPCKFPHVLEGNKIDSKVDDVTLAIINSIVMPRINEIILRSEPILKNGRAEIRFRFKTFQQARKMLAQVKAQNCRPMHGQLLRATIILTHACACHKDLFTALHAEFEQVCAVAMQEGVDVRFDQAIAGRTKVFVSVVLGSGDEDDRLITAYHVARAAFNQLLTCKVVNHPRKFVMFSSTGRQFMQDWATSGRKSYIHWDHRFQSIKLYGPPREVEIVEGHIMGLIETLGPNFVVVPLPLANASVRAARKLQPQIRALEDVMDVHVDKAAIMLTANAEGEARVRLLLKEKGIAIVKTMERAPEHSTDCALCMGPVENPFQLKACAHIFCRECIEGAGGGALPLKCPVCGQLWIWRDVATLLGDKLLRRSFEEYLSSVEGRRIYENCPSRQGCEQKFIKDPLNPGYRAIFDCDQCNLSYCIQCSHELGSPIEVHPDEKCSDIMRRFKSGISKDMELLLKLPNVSPCPSCKTVIYKDGGCYHMTCQPPRGCGAHFCWGCMERFEGERSSCTCPKIQGHGWGGQSANCRYVYHHMDHCGRPIHP